MVTVPETEKFVIVVKSIKDGGLLECTYNGKALANMRLPAAGVLRESIHKALKSSNSVNVEAMATFGQRGPIGIVGSTTKVEEEQDEDENDESNNSNDDNDDEEVDDSQEMVEDKSTESEESD